MRRRSSRDRDGRHADRDYDRDRDRDKDFDRDYGKERDKDYDTRSKHRTNKAAAAPPAAAAAAPNDDRAAAGHSSRHSKPTSAEAADESAAPAQEQLAAAIAAAGPLPSRPDKVGLGRLVNVTDSSLLKDCIRQLTCVSKDRRDLEFDTDRDRDNALIVLWDMEARQLHGVFKHDPSARPLPTSQLPGGRRHQVSQHTIMLLA
jgi:hypothetical protein